MATILRARSLHEMDLLCTGPSRASSILRFPCFLFSNITQIFPTIEYLDNGTRLRSTPLICENKFSLVLLSELSKERKTVSLSPSCFLAQFILTKH